jgi:hypothetical protein
VTFKDDGIEHLYCILVCHCCCSQLPVIGQSADTATNGGVTVGYAYGTTGFALGNSDDEIEILYNGLRIDYIAYDNGATFPDPDAHSMTLDQDYMSAELNNVGKRWCVDNSATFGGGSGYGTPGSVNTLCPRVDWCRIQWPETITASEGGSQVFYSRLYHNGVTTVSEATDPFTNLVVQLGIGPRDSSPLPLGNANQWTWRTASANTSYNSSSVGWEANNDEYMVDITLDTPVPTTLLSVIRWTTATYGAIATATWAPVPTVPKTDILQLMPASSL